MPTTRRYQTGKTTVGRIDHRGGRARTGGRGDGEKDDGDSDAERIGAGASRRRTCLPKNLTLTPLCAAVRTSYIENFRYMIRKNSIQDDEHR